MTLRAGLTCGLVGAVAVAGGLRAAVAGGLQAAGRPHAAVAGGLEAAGRPGGLKPAGYVRQDLRRDLDDILNVPELARALVGVRIESLRTGDVLYQRNSEKLVVPASNMKLFTLAVAAARLGWAHRFETRLEAAGTIENGTLAGDLIVVGTGDPSITSPDFGHPALFLEWADALTQAGVRRIDGRIVGDDDAFDDAGLGAGWAWDYLANSYAAPSGALSYNENVAAVRITPARAEGIPPAVDVAPPGAEFRVDINVRTGQAGSGVSVSVARLPGSARLVVSGRVPAGGAAIGRATTVDNPTRFFVEALRLALLDRGIAVTGGAHDLDDLDRSVNPLPRRLIVRRESAPLSSLGATMLKASQNFYAEMLLKAIGRAEGRPGSSAAGRQVVRETLAGWGISADSYVMSDGSGLSRYDYVTSDAVVALLRHVWQDEAMRGPFLAALPVGGRDGTLETRMRHTALDGRVQAKTGTIANVRALSGFLETAAGEKIVFSIVANHFTAANAEIDAVAERILMRLMTR